MALFTAHQADSPASCPVSCDGGAGLAHVLAAYAACYQVAIRANALIDEEHRLLFVLEATNREAVERFPAFLHDFGDLQVPPASSAEHAVGRGGRATGKEVVREAGPLP